MSWLNILPSSWSVVESWIKSFFIFMALLTIVPWAIVFLYDILLYIWRALYHEIPVVGGRAQGRARPRAPTLTERPSGDPRALGLARIASHEDERTYTSADEATSEAEEETESTVRRRRLEVASGSGE